MFVFGRGELGGGGKFEKLQSYKSKNFYILWIKEELIVVTVTENSGV